MRNRAKLRGTNVYIDDDLTKYERERQSRLRVWANDRRKDGMNARVKYGKVVMNGKESAHSVKKKENEKKKGGEKHKKTVGVKKNEIIGIFWNVAGVKNKRTEFWKYIEEFDIVGLLETWVDEKEWENMKQRLPKGWKWRYQEAKREKKKGRTMGGDNNRGEGGDRRGGVDTEEREGIQERRIKRRKEKLEQLKEMIREEEEDNLIIAGDFNARIGGGGGWEEDEIDKIEEGRKSKDCKVNKEGKELIKMIEERGWLVLYGEKEEDERGEWTYEKDGKRSVIDYGIVNWEAEKRIQRFEIGDRVESDHQPIIMKWTVKWKRKEIKEEESEGKKEVEKEWEELEREIKKCIPERKRGKRKELRWVLWWDEECRGKKREAHRSRREYRKTQEEEDYKRYIRKRKEYRDMCEKKKEEYRIEERSE
ncbi:PREDICTED: golgin subfamily A member 6-like protein 22, partial [Cyphomyrmex costatus]|uniref:golgin subfamily A member 6-like protein 22 n=1 Tax=Cyphomyrmex costatus TaxID=456900 RepID=UPI0008522348